jgi:hypothetical protein
MATLTVTNFSCIEIAEIELGDLTVLIGPQASGKSVISKLIYFCYDILSRQFRYIEDEKPFADFQLAVANDFKQWFPPTGWGEKRFNIAFTAGPYEVRLRRSAKRASSQVSDDLSVTFSEYLVGEYAAVLDAWMGGKRKARKSDEATEIASSREFEFFWRIQDAARTQQRKHLKRDYVGSQLFIPAGRSFFTSLGKAVTAFEHGGILDPVTVRFGRLFTSYLERRRARTPLYQNPTLRTAEKALAQSFFGGHLVFERDKEYVHAADGRKLPFSLLSSGQQELLPLWIMLPLPGAPASQRLVFIEEPEAHLFPSAQAKLTNHLASLTGGATQRGVRLFITTHSPYVLATINNLMKAFALSRAKPRVSASISEIVPKTSWLPPATVRAYAIKDGATVSLIVDDMIDGEYLDEVSGSIAEAFSDLQALEFGDEK